MVSSLKLGSLVLQRIVFRTSSRAKCRVDQVHARVNSSNSEGTFFAVLKAKDGDGCCRCVGLMSMPSQRWCQERRKQCGANYTVVEDDDLFATGCRFFYCRGLLSRFRDDDTGLRRSSCVMVVLGYSRCSWFFMFTFQCACKGQLLCTGT